MLGILVFFYCVPFTKIVKPFCQDKNILTNRISEIEKICSVFSFHLVFGCVSTEVPELPQFVSPLKQSRVNDLSISEFL